MTSKWPAPGTDFMAENLRYTRAIAEQNRVQMDDHVARLQEKITSLQLSVQHLLALSRELSSRLNTIEVEVDDLLQKRSKISNLIDDEAVEVNETETEYGDEWALRPFTPPKNNLTITKPNIKDLNPPVIDVDDDVPIQPNKRVCREL